MNLSSRSIMECRERDGAAADDRPEYVEDALQQRRRVGWRSGKPLVQHPEGVDEDLVLGEDVSEAYSHYVRGSDLYLPEAGEFLAKLFDAVDSVEDAAEELNSDGSTVRKAADLHGLEIPEGGESADEGTEDKIKLPSGECIPLEVCCRPVHSDPRVLTQLLATEGMGVEEAARWFSETVGEQVSPQDVREAAQDCNLLRGGGDSSSPIPDRRRTVTAEDRDVVSTPW
ncbi:hypothetical protein [Halorarum halobium]|uniref:hypothetical protein n=1 Tax=Halorarum halobium TaxID=3075121 RepID=UPI0028AF0E4C|nr:hypothetical protein [Halobaculum sp. XH14]